MTTATDETGNVAPAAGTSSASGLSPTGATGSKGRQGPGRVLREAVTLSGVTTCVPSGHARGLSPAIRA
jgi:hypothetical protein